MSMKEFILSLTKTELTCCLKLQEGDGRKKATRLPKKERRIVTLVTILLSLKSLGNGVAKVHSKAIRKRLQTGIALKGRLRFCS